MKAFNKLNLTELSKIYDEHLSKEFVELERLRGEAKKFKLAACGAVGSLLLGFLTYFYFLSTEYLAPIICITLLGIIIFSIPAYLTFGYGKIYRSAFKDKIVNKIFSLVLPEATYEPDNCISEYDFNTSKLFKKSDRYQGDDFSRAKIDKTEISISEVHSEIKRTSVDKNGNTRTYWETQFKGFFIIADFHKNFIGQTFLYPKVMPSSLKFLSHFADNISSVFGSDLETIELEDIVFNENFKIRTTNDTTARYILTPTMMEGINNLKVKFNGSNVYMSFIGGKVNIAISQHKNNFEPRVFSKSVNREIVNNIYHLLESIFAVIDHMQLNTRIWTKK